HVFALPFVAGQVLETDRIGPQHGLEAAVPPEGIGLVETATPCLAKVPGEAVIERAPVARARKLPNNLSPFPGAGHRAVHAGRRPTGGDRGAKRQGQRIEAVARDRTEAEVARGEVMDIGNMTLDD